MPVPSIKEIFPGHVSGYKKDRFEESPEIAGKLDPKVKESLDYINRGDLGVPSHALRAAAFQYSGQCGDVNQEYMLCRKEEGDPRRCLRYNSKVSDCAEDFFKKVTDACADSFVAFSSCLETSVHRSMKYCRKEQLVFDRCLFDKLGFDKPRHAVEFDQKIKTDRPKPVNPYNYQPSLDTRNHPSVDFFSKPIGKTRETDN